MMAGCL